MKKIIILLTLLSIILGLKIDVYAETFTDKFFIAEEISGIYFGKSNGQVTQYRKAKFKRRVDDNQIVYCIEPFEDMIENSNYTGYDYDYDKILNLPQATWERISLLSYYGYGYKNHTDEKWYAITQLMIWQAIEEDADFFYTKTFKGKRVTKFIDETNELNQLVDNHNKKVSFDNEIINTTINTELIIEDRNQVLENYQLVNNQDIARIEGNNLIINTTSSSEKIELNLIKRDTLYKSLPIVYVSNKYQNVLAVGSCEDITSSFTLIVDSGNITINKKDSETQESIPQGEALLEGTTYELYDENGLYINKIEINDRGIGTLSNVKYGNYKLVETKSGKGYLLDNYEYFFNINYENKNIILNLYNQVIKRKVKITKYLDDNNNKKIESNITFQIMDYKGDIVKEVTTDEMGTVTFELPYGTYQVKQINTTDGYYKVDDFQITINEDSDEVIEYYLYDLKVPNTYQKSYFNITLSILILTLFSSFFIIRKYAEKN